MLAYIKGTLEDKTRDTVVIDVMGLGYKVFMSEKNINDLGNLGDTVKVHTYYRVREDDISIFGFNTKEELHLFEMLLSVSGIGAKTALTMLATIEPSVFAISVISDDVTALTEIPGIGAKSAKRIILELKDKLKAEQVITELEEAYNSNVKKKQENSNVTEAISALQVLGYNKKVIEAALEKLDAEEMSVEEIIKKGLTILSAK